MIILNLAGLQFGLQRSWIIRTQISSDCLTVVPTYTEILEHTSRNLTRNILLIYIHLGKSPANTQDPPFKVGKH